MIARTAIWFASLLILTLSVLSTAWVDKVSQAHALAILMTFFSMPLFWWGCIVLFKVDKAESKCAHKKR